MENHPLKASITAAASYQLGDPILITFEIENIGSETYQFLKWDTPLEHKVRDDFIILQRDGERIPYDGVFVKRGDPSPESYVLIGPGEKLKETVDISIAYPIHKPGDYTATLKATIHDIFPIVGTAKQAPRPRSQFEPQPLNPSTVQFKVVSDKEAKLAPRLTSGEIAREAEKQAKKAPKAKGPSFNGGTSTQQADTIVAHNNAHYFAALAANQLSVGPASSNALYQTWFGAFDQSRYDKVAKNYTDISNVLLSEQVTYDFTGSSPAGDSCTAGDYAFTYAGVRTVWICGSYLSAAQISTDCKFGTLIHEWSHAICKTKDHAYQQSNCQTLATNDPAKAIDNGDSHEYFAEHLVQSDFGKSFTFITDRNTFGRDEIEAMLAKASPAVIQQAFYVVADGYWPDLLGITTSSLGTSPNIKPTIPSPVSGMTVAVTSLEAEDNTLPVAPQRFTWVCQIAFTDLSGFPPNAGQVQTMTLTATLLSHSCSAQIQLIREPNPFELDGETSWLSTDLRVFQIRAGESRFGETIGSTPADASTFIKKVIENLNAKNSGGETFDSISTDQQTSWLELSQQVNKTNVFNFAIAKVRYRGTIDISNVRVFFRLFPAATTSASFDAGTTYRRAIQGTSAIPLLGLSGSGDLLTIPCFAEPRVNSAAVSLATQTDPTNVRTITRDPSGIEVGAYFGCWLDINQTQPQFPTNPSPSNGPWTSGCNSIQELIRNAHQCLVAEIAFDPAPINPGDSPADSDKLAQRNLAIVPSANPGYEASRRILTAFDLHPIAGNEQPPAAPDELLIEWGNTPRGSIATIYIPEVDADQIVKLAGARCASHTLTKLDDHSIQLTVGGISYVPLPPGTALGLTGLLSIDLPATVRKGEVYTIVVRQVTDAVAEPVVVIRDAQVRKTTPAATAAYSAGNLPQWRRIVGSYQITIPVSTKEEILPREMRLLSNLRWIQKAIPENNRWLPVFQRYVGQIADRVDALGGDSSIVLPSPSGEWHGGTSGRCRLWEMINAVLLAALLALLGITSGVAILAMAVLLVIAAYLWWTQCQPRVCSLLRVLLVGAGIGALILVLLMLLEISSPQLTTVLVATVVLAAIAGVVGFNRHCF